MISATRFPASAGLEPKQLKQINKIKSRTAPIDTSSDNRSAIKYRKQKIVKKSLEAHHVTRSPDRAVSSFIEWKSVSHAIGCCLHCLFVRDVYNVAQVAAGANLITDLFGIPRRSKASNASDIAG